MFRVKFYYQIGLLADNTVTLTSETRDTHAEADELFDQLRATTGQITGGHVEQHVPGIGWVIADEVETVQILARRREDFGGLGNVSNGL